MRQGRLAKSNRSCDRNERIIEDLYISTDQTTRMTAIWLDGPRRSLTRFGKAPLFREGLYNLGKGCYAWMVPNGSWGETNIGLIECAGKSVLIDTCWDLKFTRELLSFCAEILVRSPVELVVNTHADGDHCWGNQLFRGREIIASHACISQMHHLDPRAIHMLKRSGRLLGAVPIADIDKLGRYVSHMFGPYDFSSLSITDPTQGFSGEKTLRVNGVEIVLREVGPGHTDGDLIVYVPSRKTVYAGDVLFVGSTPVMWAGPVENIVTALRLLLQLDAEVIVPGHGPLATRTDVQAAIDYWEFAEGEIHKRYCQGMRPDQAAMDLVTGAAFQQLQYVHWDSPERMVTNAFTMYRDWDTSFKPLPGKLGQMDLLRRQARLAYTLLQPKPFHTD